MAVTTLFAGIAVSDYAATLAWYERLFGRPPDMIPHDHEAVWHVSEAGLIYVVADPGRAGKGLLTLIVDDLDAQIAELAQRGLETAPIEIVGEAARKAAITDPEGNMISFVELA